MFAGVPREGIIMMPNVDTVYKVPLTVARDLGALLTKFSGIAREPDLAMWRRLAERDRTDYAREVRVGLVAKYIDNTDTYLSVIEALKSAAWSKKCEVAIKWINAETVQDSDFEGIDAVLVPGGFGSRGVDGKIAAADYAYRHKLPYLGICLGLQVAVIAAARRGGVAGAHSDEFEPGDQNVVYIIPVQEGRESTGGTLRLGDYVAKFTSKSLAARVYDAREATERHRHRYEVNLEFRDVIEHGGLVISGTSPDGRLVEFVEAPDHPYYIATQAHPEFRSRPMRAHPLFVGLIQAALAQHR